MLFGDLKISQMQRSFVLSMNLSDSLKSEILVLLFQWAQKKKKNKTSRVVYILFVGSYSSSSLCLGYKFPRRLEDHHNNDWIWGLMFFLRRYGMGKGQASLYLSAYNWLYMWSLSPVCDCAWFTLGTWTHFLPYDPWISVSNSGVPGGMGSSGEGDL